MKVRGSTRSVALRLTSRYGGTRDAAYQRKARDDHRACLSARVTSGACKGQDLTFNACVREALDIHDKRSGAHRLLPVWESTGAAKTSLAFPVRVPGRLGRGELHLT